MTRYSLPDMSCGHCEAVVKRTVATTDPEARLAIDLGARQITLESSHEALVLSALAEEGYPATPV